MKRPFLTSILAAAFFAPALLMAAEPRKLLSEMKPEELAAAIRPLAGGSMDSVDGTTNILVTLDLEREEAGKLAKEILKAWDHLEDLRAESIRDVPRTFSKELVIPALEKKEVKKAIDGISFPRTVDEPVRERLRQVLHYQLEPQLCHPVRVSFGIVDHGLMVPESGPQIRVDALETYQEGKTRLWIGGLMPESEAPPGNRHHYKYSYIATPDLLAVRDDLRRSGEAAAKAAEEEKQRRTPERKIVRPE